MVFTGPVGPVDGLVFLGGLVLPFFARWAVFWWWFFALVAAVFPSGKRRFGLDLVAVTVGWAAAWLYRLDGTHLDRFLQMALLGPVLALLVSRSTPRLLQIGFFLGGVGVALGVLIEVGRGSGYSVGRTMAWPWPRGAGILGNPNVAGAYLAAILPLAYASWGRGEFRGLRWGLGGVILAALICTGSRGAWLAAVAGAIWFLTRRRPGYVFPFLAGIFLFFLLPLPVGKRLWAGLLGHDPTVKARLAIWRQAVGLFWACPLAGWGTTPPLGWAAHPHNLFFEILLGGGILAVAGFIPLVRRFFRFCSSPAKGEEEEVFMAVLVALLVFGLVDAVLATPVLAVLFWSAVGIALGRE